MIANEGFLPTNVTERALKAKLAKPVRARLLVKGGEIVDGKPSQEARPHPRDPPRRRAPGTRPATNRRTVSWVVKAPARGAKAEVVITSEKGGTERRTLTLR